MTVGDQVPEGAAMPQHDAHAEPGQPAEKHAIGDEEYVELLPAGGWSRRVLKAIGLAEQVIGASLILVILVLVLIQIAQRYIHTFGGWPWTGEVARLALVWCTFILSGYLMAQDRHITIKVVDLVLPEWILGLIRLLAHLFVVVTCLGMGYATYRLIADDIGQRTPAAEIPVAWVYVMPLIGFLLTATRGLLLVGLVDLRQLKRPGEPQA